jgi:hypothetical protein
MANTTRTTAADEALTALLEAARERASEAGHHHKRAPFTCPPTDPSAHQCRRMHEKSRYRLFRREILLSPTSCHRGQDGVVLVVSEATVEMDSSRLSVTAAGRCRTASYGSNPAGREVSSLPLLRLIAGSGTGQSLHHWSEGLHTLSKQRDV